MALKFWKWVLTPILLLYVAAWGITGILYFAGGIEKMPRGSMVFVMAGNLACTANLLLLIRSKQKPHL